MTTPDPLDWTDLAADVPPDVEPDAAAPTTAGGRPPRVPDALPGEPKVDAATAARRLRVLAHPDLAARLTHAPHWFSKAENWTGYLPPEMWREVPNNSPQRRGLLEILAAVDEREATTRAPTWLTRRLRTSSPMTRPPAQPSAAVSGDLITPGDTPVATSASSSAALTS